MWQQEKSKPLSKGVQYNSCKRRREVPRWPAPSPQFMASRHKTQAPLEISTLLNHWIEEPHHKKCRHPNKYTLRPPLSPLLRDFKKEQNVSVSMFYLLNIPPWVCIPASKRSRVNKTCLPFDLKDSNPSLLHPSLLLVPSFLLILPSFLPWATDRDLLR